jgi:hypothetical protein
MTSDLPGQASPLEPGVDWLFQTLTAPASTAELAGEQEALAMFRANVVPPALRAAEVGRDVGNPVRSRWGRVLRLPVRWSVRLAAAATLVVGGAAAAAYASVLPTPVQHLAHTVLGFAGVPDSRQGNSGAGAGHHHHGVTAGQHGPSPARQQPTPTLTPGASATPASASPTAAVGAGHLLLSATAVDRQIIAGSGDVIDGQLTRAGAGVPGMTVTLLERPAGQHSWHVVGTGQTTSAGNVAVSVPAIGANAVFRLAIPRTALSRAVAVTVHPPLAAVLVPGAGGAGSSLVISAQYGDRGDLVLVQVLTNDGHWRYLRSRRLNAAGQATFGLAPTQLRGRDIRAVLMATVRHGASVSNTVTVGQ